MHTNSYENVYTMPITTDEHIHWVSSLENMTVSSAPDDQWQKMMCYFRCVVMI